ncbi:DUF418 domain-containing protein [Nocardiopsis mangrovi]|uniref:DUF418 domain-containing protein n=1 Tax=Nocardiopsis mangrovi TaxID=1179818 RepID=A0ABV9DPR8_9ACTN
MASPLPSGPAQAQRALPASGRALAPDLARGVMLLLIATVHAHMIWQMQSGTGAAATLPDTLATLAMVVFGEARGYPMFAALFGYGLAGILIRAQESGRDWAPVRGLLRRRGRWLVVFGLAHTVLLFPGDILAVYGAIALLLTPVLRFSGRRLLVHAAVWGVAGSLLYSVLYYVLLGSVGGSASGTAPPQDYFTDMAIRLVSWPVTVPLFLLTAVLPFLVGVWAGRRRLLDEPARHTGLLVKTALIGVAVGALGGLPQALTAIGAWAEPPIAASLAMGWLHTLSGYAGGFGYAALIALAAVAIGGRRGLATRALTACGQRSMTCYLLQSLAWLILFTPYTLDLAGALNGMEAIGVGAAVWLATVVVAELLSRSGRRGPTETALRRLTYGPADSARPAHDPPRGAGVA